MTIASMTKKSFHQPPQDALVKIQITLASTNSVAWPLQFLKSTFNFNLKLKIVIHKLEHKLKIVKAFKTTLQVNRINTNSAKKQYIKNNSKQTSVWKTIAFNQTVFVVFFHQPYITIFQYKKHTHWKTILIHPNLSEPVRIHFAIRQRAARVVSSPFYPQKAQTLIKSDWKAVSKPRA